MKEGQLVQTEDNKSVLAEQAAPISILGMIAKAASDPSVDLDKMERLMAMHERMTARDAELAFNEAMKRVQTEVPKIKRNKNNEQTRSQYADLEVVNQAIIPVYTKEGFSLSFGTADCPLEGHYRITCAVSHSAGHTRHYQADIPADGKGMKGNDNKTGTHAFGSTMSYARRYLTLLIFNITLTNEDTDGSGIGAPKITEDQTATLQALIDDIGANKTAFLAHLKVQSLEDIPAKAYEYAVGVLEQKRKAAK